MDPELFNLVGDSDRIRRVGRTDEVEVKTKEGVQRYKLKPLDALYGEGYGASSVSPDNDLYLPLLMCIEEELLHAYRDDPDLTDAPVALALDRLTLNPGTDAHDNALCCRVQIALRLLLSLNKFSRQEVKQALRVIAKSVERHSKHGGITGYLDFIEFSLGRHL